MPAAAVFRSQAGEDKTPPIHAVTLRAVGIAFTRCGYIASEAELYMLESEEPLLVTCKRCERPAVVVDPCRGCHQEWPDACPSCGNGGRS